MSRAQMLYRLQTLDSELDKAKRQLAEIVAQLGESDPLKQSQHAAEVAQKNLRQAQTTMQDLDLELKGLSQKIVSHEKKLYSGKLLNPKEAANLQDEVASLKRWHSKREELLLEAMVAVEEAEQQLVQAQAKLSTVEADWAAGQGQLKLAQQGLAAEAETLLAERPLITQMIKGDDLRHYEILRQKKGGVAIVRLKNGVCEGCGISPPYNDVQRAGAGADLIYCEVCGRIFYAV